MTWRATTRGRNRRRPNRGRTAEMAERKRRRSMEATKGEETSGASLDDLVAALDGAKAHGRVAVLDEPQGQADEVVLTPADDGEIHLSDALPMAEDDDLSAV